MARKKKDTTKSLFDVWLRRKMEGFQPTALTAKQVAKAVGVTEGTVSRWLKEGRKPERKQIVPLSRLFRVSPTVILKVTDPDEFTQTLKDIEGRQPDEIDVLAQVPELRAFMVNLANMTPEKRAAIVMLVPEEDKGSTGSPPPRE